MARSLSPKSNSQHTQIALDRIRNNIANSMVGRVVNVLVSADRTAHGVVTGVDMQTGTPRLVVAGFRYDLAQVLTVFPPAFN